MAFNLLDALSSTVGTQLLNQGPQLFGESAGAMRSAVGSILPTILGGVMKQGSTPDGAAGLMRLMNEPGVEAATQPGTDNSALMNSGGGLLKKLFGDKADALASSVSSVSGVKASSAIGLLSLAVPMVLGFIKKYVTQNNLNANGLSNLLAGQSGFLQGKLDNRITQSIGLGDAGSFLSGLGGSASRAAGAGAAAAGDFGNRAANAASGAAQAAGNAGRSAGRSAMGFATQTAEGAHHHGPRVGRMLQWLLALIVLALLFAVFRSCAMNRESAQSVTDRAGEAMQSAANKAGETAQSVGNAMKSLALPGGGSLNTPSGGFIEKTYMSLSNPGAEGGTGYALDAVTFQTGSASLLESSNQQLSDLAALLQAYPNASITITGYTDDTGDAEANRMLSQQRAEAVKDMLVGKGIAGERITTVGLGPDQPIADNSTDEGKAKNRRVEVTVTNH
jgi:OmpA-OmpF porin, OOP family